MRTNPGAKLTGFFSFVFLIFNCHAVFAQAPAVEEFVIIGGRDAVRQLPGSGAVVTAEQINNEVASDINQLLKTVPGIYIREEEGLGLRPNIGIRGATTRGLLFSYLATPGRD
jgi:Fe(3+) dicitrate transport protein